MEYVPTISVVAPTLSVVTEDITIEDIGAPTDTHSTHLVALYDHNIHTTVTRTASVVDGYISKILSIHRQRLNHLVAGLDIEWRPNNMANPVATLQLCVGHRCLVFQLLHADRIPQSLIDFLGNPSFRIVGVGIAQDVQKLWSDYGIRVGNTVDLKDLAVENTERDDLWNAGLKKLAKVVLGMEIEKPERITRSKWDDRRLSLDQIKYACIDAFVSFQIGNTFICVNELLMSI